jgi:DnaJ-class molecular chaperone
MSELDDFMESSEPCENCNTNGRVIDPDTGQDIECPCCNGDGFITA